MVIETPFFSTKKAIRGYCKLFFWFLQLEVIGEGGPPDGQDDEVDLEVDGEGGLHVVDHEVDGEGGLH